MTDDQRRNEQRERYRSAIVGANLTSPLASRAADAAIAVSDAETADLREENARLRAELVDEWDYHQAAISRVQLDRDSAAEENIWLRAELAETVARHAQREREYAADREEMLQHRATIERVQAVCDAYPNAPWYHGHSVRTALKGEQQ